LIWQLIRRPRQALAALVMEGGKKWLWMALVATLAVLLPVLVAAPITTRLAQESMRAALEAQGGQGQEINPETQQQITSFTTNPLFTVVLPGGGAVLATWAGWLVWAAVLHFGSTLLGGGSRFGQMWQVVVWAWLPYALRGLIQTVFILISGEVIANPGLSGLIEKPDTTTDILAAMRSPGLLALQTLLSRIDLFLVWNLVLLTAGVMAVAKLSGRKAVLIILGIWVLFMVFAIGSAVVPSMLFAGSF
jgi:hypothetical protein